MKQGLTPPFSKHIPQELPLLQRQPTWGFQPMKFSRWQIGAPAIHSSAFTTSLLMCCQLQTTPSMCETESFEEWLTTRSS